MPYIFIARHSHQRSTPPSQLGRGQASSTAHQSGSTPPTQGGRGQTPITASGTGSTAVGGATTAATGSTPPTQPVELEEDIQLEEE